MLQTRQKFKEAYGAEFAAVIERAEKQIILAKHGRRLLDLLDDTPVMPGDDRVTYDQGPQARQVLNDVEDDLREWTASSNELYQAEAAKEARRSPTLKGKGKEESRHAGADSELGSSEVAGDGGSAKAVEAGA